MPRRHIELLEGGSHSRPCPNTGTSRVARQETINSWTANFGRIFHSLPGDLKMYVHFLIILAIYLFVFTYLLSTYSPTCLSVWLSVCLFACLPVVYLPACMPCANFSDVCLPVCLSACLGTVIEAALASFTFSCSFPVTQFRLGARWDLSNDNDMDPWSPGRQASVCIIYNNKTTTLKLRQWDHNNKTTTIRLEQSDYKNEKAAEARVAVGPRWLARPPVDQEASNSLVSGSISRQSGIWKQCFYQT